jgi:PAS domain S-box-containing protein
MTDSPVSKPVILIVEDNPDNLDLLCDGLRQADFEPLVARSGESALRQVEFAQPDLILLDILLPGIDGLETCRRLKQRPYGQEIPILFLSGLSDTEEKVKGFEAGGVDYVTKPFRLEEVIARINTHLTIRQLQHQLQIQNMALEEQRLWFQTLADSTFEGIIIHQGGAIIQVNRVLENMLGYQQTELLGRNVLEFISSDEQDLVRQYIDENTEHPYESKAIRKDGDIFPIEVQAKTLRHEDAQFRIAAIRDISWQKTIEAEKFHLERENLTLRTTIKDRYKFGDIIGKSPAMQEIYELIAHTAATDANVIVNGESGTGKELVARTIHRLSDRGERSFVPVNCGAIPENLFESEFFGHRKGAFTGADRDKAGYFDEAHQGTLFLDEVGELSPLLQVKLLRAIEQGEYMPVGSNTHKTVDVRIIAATNRDLEQQVSQGLMREDFFYRLSVIAVQVPPLRERKEDLPLLIDHFLGQHQADDSCPVLPARVYQILLNHDWPGNIRELQNVLQRYVTVKRLEFPGSRGPAAIALNHDNCPVLETASASQNLQEALEAFEKQFLQKVLEQHHWHKSNTAEALGIGRKTLYRKMKQFGLI